MELKECTYAMKSLVILILNPAFGFQILQEISGSVTLHKQHPDEAPPELLYLYKSQDPLGRYYVRAIHPACESHKTTFQASTIARVLACLKCCSYAALP